jgi:hypothetical protein
MVDPSLNRRELLAAGAALGLAAAAPAVAAPWQRVLDFSATGDGDGWPGWTCPGVANLRRSGGRGLLEAGSDVFPCDPRPVAFAVDQRFVEGDIAAVVEAAGAGAGVVLRRVGPRTYYAAIYDDEQQALVLVRRAPDGAHELGRVAVPHFSGPLPLTLHVAGRRPTVLEATLGAATVRATDSFAALQRAGDPGVLATARTLFPSQGPPVLPSLGNLHLLPYGVQEGQAFLESPAGQAVLGEIRERSTAVFSRIIVRGLGSPQATAPSLIAAGTGAPLAGGALLRVATDVPARVEIEIAGDPSFRQARRLTPVRTNALDGAFVAVRGRPAGRRVHWRARVRRHGRVTVGPTRSFRALPRGGGTVRIAVAACAAQFGPIFEHLAAAKPDVFVWQGDLNYPDTLGPLAQTVPAYAGIWRDFLANPLLAPLLERTAFAVQRDDHDYGVQDANSTNLVAWGLTPWQGLMERRTYYKFSAGLADVWVLDQRLHKSEPTAQDGPGKTLLGAKQREWLLRTLGASKAPFKVICSPCTVAIGANGRDGNWASGFNAERALVLQHIRERVSGRTIFVTGDTHWTLAYEKDGLFEARPCPLGIPTPNDITLTSPNVAEDARSEPGVLYTDDNQGHFALLEIGGGHLDLWLVREDGAKPFHRRFPA